MLQNAASRCVPEMMKLLVAAGADANLAGKDGGTPLWAVCRNPRARREAVLAILFEAGAEQE